jgi:hypothetical protein
VGELEELAHLVRPHHLPVLGVSCLMRRRRHLALPGRSML